MSSVRDKNAIINGVVSTDVNRKIGATPYAVIMGEVSIAILLSLFFKAVKNKYSYFCSYAFNN